MSGSAPLTVAQWHEFLGEYGRQVLASPDQERERFTPDGVITVPRFAPEAHQSGWLGSEPCREADLEAAEERLGRPLPPSFRNFYLVSNGWTDAGQFGEDVWPLEEVQWLREHEFGYLIEAWTDVLDDDQLAVLKGSLIIAYADGAPGTTGCWRPLRLLMGWSGPRISGRPARGRPRRRSRASER